ncbi:MAG: biopolymer transporter ExbD [Pirellulaceae bacterium]|nr:biopolymer transporter ExbD [Pirellulaceae bacterium]
MSIKITCLQCGATHKVNNRLAGRRVRCPECDTAVHVPELPDPTLSSEPAEPVEPESVQEEVVEAVPDDAVDIDGKDASGIDAVVDDSDSSQQGDDSQQRPDQAAAVVGGVVAAEAITPPSPLAQDLDDDDDDAMLRSKGDEDELDMTPMVDVTFLLLIFFVVTASFQLQKSIMMPRQQTDAPSTSSVEEDPEELDQVELQIDEFGAFLVLAADWEAETPGKQNLISKLKEAKGELDAKLIIKVQEQAKLQALVDGMDAGTIAGYDEIIVTQVEDFD